MNTIDPVEYGKLIQAVEELQRKVNGMDNDIKRLVELANQSKGGLWVGMGLASFFGGIVTFFASHFFTK